MYARIYNYYYILCVYMHVFITIIIYCVYVCTYL